MTHKKIHNPVTRNYYPVREGSAHGRKVKGLWKDNIDKELIGECLLTPIERRQWGALYLDYPDVMRFEICKEQITKAIPIIRKAVAEEIKGKLYHPPIALKNIEIAEETLAEIMVQVRKYYQIVFDEAVGIPSKGRIDTPFRKKGDKTPLTN